MPPPPARPLAFYPHTFLPIHIIPCIAPRTVSMISRTVYFPSHCAMRDVHEAGSLLTPYDLLLFMVMVVVVPPIRCLLRSVYWSQKCFDFTQYYHSVIKCNFIKYRHSVNFIKNTFSPSQKVE
jgi:hypothetical protein